MTSPTGTPFNLRNDRIRIDATGTAPVELQKGSGVPTHTATRGTLYLRTDAAADAGAYQNVDGSTTWVLLETADVPYNEVEVTIATGDVATMNATPVEVIAAPAAGKAHIVESCRWFLDYATTAYDAAAAGDTLVLKYTDGSGAAVVDAVAGDAIGAASADYHTIVRPVAELIPVAAAAVVAHINTGEWYGAAGDSPLKAQVVYRTVTLAF